jgi:type VI secretion system protein ImpF
MARYENEFRITPSVLDRLLDFDPRSSTEAPKSRSTSIAELRQSVRRDLEWLLNTRSMVDPALTELEETRRSVACFGIPDFTGIAMSGAAEQKRLVASIETAIRTFEPRFLDLKITLEPINELDRQLRFRIEARLDVDPAPIPVVFDSALQSGTGGYTVKER